MIEYVVDASVILTWIVGDEREPDHETADEKFVRKMSKTVSICLLRDL